MRIKSALVKRILLAQLAVLLLMAFFAWDARHFNKAGSEYLESKTLPQVVAFNAATDAEVATAKRNECRKHLNLTADPVVLTEQWRDCYLQGIKVTKTHVGAMFASGLVSTWLLGHPGDIEMRTAALDAVERARDFVKAARPYAFDPYEKMVSARNASRFTPFLGLPMEANYNDQVDMLANAEMRIRAPEAVARVASKEREMYARVDQ